MNDWILAKHVGRSGYPSGNVPPCGTFLVVPLDYPLPDTYACLGFADTVEEAERLVTYMIKHPTARRPPQRRKGKPG